MTRTAFHKRRGTTNSLYVLTLASAAVLLLLLMLVWRTQHDTRRGGSGSDTRQLFVYCAAGMRYPMEEISKAYQAETGVAVQLQYGGSNTLLSQLEVSETGDLYLAADDSYIQLARNKQLVDEVIPLAEMRPVIAVHRDNETISGIEDLLQPSVRVALGNPDAAAIGKAVRQLLEQSGHWDALEQNVTEHGVFKPTVNEVANDVDLGSVDAGIIWDSTVAQYPNLKAVKCAELDAGRSLIEIGVLRSTKDPTAALRFARFVGARDKGLAEFARKGFQVVEGDTWAAVPELTFFAGAVNRRALEPIISAFESREGVRVNTKYNGCGILTAEMKILSEDQSAGFPDTYMACDVYYLKTVEAMFQDAVNVSDTDIVIAVSKGNPKKIEGLQDLLRPDIRLVLGHPDQCTIGILSRRLLEGAGIYDRLLAEKDIPRKPTSAMLVPDVVTGAADAALAYITDTRAESEKIDVIRIDSPLARAIQPFSIARSSTQKNLSRRLFATIAHSRDKFESAGFHWLLDDASDTERSRP